MKLINASELSVAQKYEEDIKQICLESCGPQEDTICKDMFLDSEDHGENTSVSKDIAKNGSFDQNQFKELFENDAQEIDTAASNESSVSNIFAVPNALVAFIVPTTSNILAAPIVPKFLNGLTAPIVPKFYNNLTTSNCNIALEDRDKQVDLVPISLPNISSILLQDSKTPKSMPYLIVLRECSSDYDRTSTLSFQVVGEGLNKVFLLSKINTSSDLQAFCQQFCQNKNLVLYEILDKDLITNEFDAKRLTDKEIKQYCNKFETFTDEEITCENEEIQLNSSSDIFKVREVGENEFQRIEVKQNNGKHSFKVKIL